VTNVSHEGEKEGWKTKRPARYTVEHCSTHEHEDQAQAMSIVIGREDGELRLIVEVLSEKQDIYTTEAESTQKSTKGFGYNSD